MEHRISVLFLRQKIKKDQQSLFPLYMQVTVNGERLEQSIQRYVNKVQWSATFGRVKGTNEQARQVNLYLDTLNSKVLRLEREMTLDGVTVNFSNFREKWLGLTEPIRMQMAEFQQHNDKMAALIWAGNDYYPATLDRYNTCRDHVQAFIQWKYKAVDIDIKRLDFDFVAGLEFWQKTHRSWARNTTLKYISNLKKIVNGCIRRGWVTRDPCAGFKRTKQELEREALTEAELETMLSKAFPTDRQNYVWDIFLFSCYTGLAYADVKKLHRSEILPGVDGNFWIFTHRQKTDTQSLIPLAPASPGACRKIQGFSWLLRFR